MDSEFVMIEGKIFNPIINSILPGRLELEFFSSRMVDALLRMLLAKDNNTKVTRQFDMEIRGGDQRLLSQSKLICIYKGCFIHTSLIDYPMPSLGGAPEITLVPLFYIEKKESEDSDA